MNEPWEWDDVLEGNGGAEEEWIQEGNVDDQSIEGWEHAWNQVVKNQGLSGQFNDISVHYTMIAST